jgi:hypothetical protein
MTQTCLSHLDFYIAARYVWRCGGVPAEDVDFDSLVSGINSACQRALIAAASARSSDERLGTKQVGSQHVDTQNSEASICADAKVHSYVCSRCLGDVLSALSNLRKSCQCVHGKRMLACGLSSTECTSCSCHLRTLDHLHCAICQVH